MLSRSVPAEASLGAHGGHTLACLVTLPLLPTGITVGGHRATLAPDDRVALSTSSACDAPFFDRPSLPFVVTLVLAKTSATCTRPSRGSPCGGHAGAVAAQPESAWLPLAKGGVLIEPPVIALKDGLGAPRADAPLEGAELPVGVARGIAPLQR